MADGRRCCHQQPIGSAALSAAFTLDLYVQISPILMSIKVIAITGSLRKASVNAGLLRAAASLAPKHGMEFTIVSADLPLYNQDLEEAGPAGDVFASVAWSLRVFSRALSGLPESVKALRGHLAAADAVFFSCEEFNYSISGIPSCDFVIGSIARRLHPSSPCCRCSEERHRLGQSLL